MGKLFLLFMISSFVPFNSINLNNFDSSSFYAYENNHYYLDIEIVSKYGSCWTIEVTNNSNENITFGYNAKMCGQAAARDWNSNLRDLLG